MAFSPDGWLAATADDSGSSTQIESLAFSADGSRVHSVGRADGRLVTHLIAPGLLKRGLCKASGQLTEREWGTHVQDLDHRKTC